MKQRWTEEHYIHSDNCDFKRVCKLSTLLEWMQRAGDAHIAALGAPIDEMMQQHGMAWMLTTIDLELIRMPEYGETITLVTWNKGAKGVQWLRDFRVYNAKEETIGQARTVWILVDLNKRRILRASALPYVVEANEEDSVGDIPERVNIADDVELEHTYTLQVRQSSIDMNGHLNNARFADICLDALTPPELEQRLVRFRISYLQEAVLGDEIQIHRAQIPNGENENALNITDLTTECFITGQTVEGKRYFDAYVQLTAV
ncbi:acyl-[acyl-carrier-protein] thioesterase [Paenibacillus agilis]|uniref:Acyl-[acyl-carrier-protein] thioesterase n=1 Tax=Paenibacillus agilis TaxID=3020863 RepID=A0A559IGK3_9BACL|nr:acyl-ACP thioesterase domain-containing protein [Paenibacillus agilis]TVX86788.1 acyl-[acyl-carrier-protein] thioesterase [Paenibacillus agilis]